MEPNPAQPGGIRVRISMELVRSSLSVAVVESHIGAISGDHLLARPHPFCRRHNNAPDASSLVALGSQQWPPAGILR